MADFNINFRNNEDFVFTDLTDYSGLGTVDKTDLVVTYPPISGVTPVSLDVFDENVASLGDPFTFVIADQVSLGTLTDGVYQFTFNVLDSNPTVIDTVTKYYVNYHQVYLYMINLIDSNIDDECSDIHCKIGMINALIDTAIRQAEDGLFAKAQEIMDYLAGVVDGCC